MHKFAALIAVVGALAPAGGASTDVEASVNPVRRVISLLEAMSKKVAKEGETEEELYKKFMCYCTSTGGDIAQSISEGQTKVPQLQTDIEEAEESLKTTKLDLKTAQEDRAAAKGALATAIAEREKDNKMFVESSGELTEYIEGITKAIGAIEKGMSGASLLQAAESMRMLRRAITASSSATEYDRQMVSSFLQGRSVDGYVPKGGEVVGILKQMQEDFEASLKEKTEDEGKSVATFEELEAAKKKQIDVLSAAIEKKIAKVGELQVNIVGMKQDLTTTEGALAEDLKFAESIKKDCDGKAAEWEERKKTRAEELVAIHETIKILNSDDALELFKKTLPSPSLLQVEVSSRARRHQARELIDRARQGKAPAERAQLDFLALALQGRDFSFAKVIKMIDEMIKLLANEEAEDADKKDYCLKSLDTAEDKAKALSSKIEDYKVSLASAEESLGVLVKEIDELTKGIAALDKSVEAATAQRKAEHDEYKELMSSDAAAKELLNFAKNRLNQFYNPKLYKPPAKQELSEQESIAKSMSGASAVQLDNPAVLMQVAMHDAPPPPPETWGAYSKKGEESTGAIAMIDLLVKDLDKEMTEADTEEKNAQKSYEEMMADSASKRAADLKSISEKTKEKAAQEEAKESDTNSLKTAEKQLMATKKYEMDLHVECDWLVKYFDVRKESRAQEVDNLKSAKAVLSGADYSLLQDQGAARKLRGGA